MDYDLSFSVWQLQVGWEFMDLLCNGPLMLKLVVSCAPLLHFDFIFIFLNRAENKTDETENLNTTKAQFKKQEPKAIVVVLKTTILIVWT